MNLQLSLSNETDSGKTDDQPTMSVVIDILNKFNNFRSSNVKFWLNTKSR
jgi:hypothetical protein